MVKKDFEEASKIQWVRKDSLNPSVDQLKLGCLQRIANATELTAKRYQDLIDERDKYKRWYESSLRTEGHQLRRIKALRGVITKMKKLNGLKNP